MPCAPDRNSTSDAIVKKLDFYRQGESEKHLRDIAGILKTSLEQLDMAYIAHWTQQMGLSDVWIAVQDQVK
jgi:hypothetical protein